MAASPSRLTWAPPCSSLTRLITKTAPTRRHRPTRPPPMKRVTSHETRSRTPTRTCPMIRESPTLRSLNSDHAPVTNSASTRSLTAPTTALMEGCVSLTSHPVHKMRTAVTAASATVLRRAGTAHVIWRHRSHVTTRTP